MIITKNKLFGGIIIFGLITLLFILLDVQYFFLREIFSCIFLTTIPGLLIMLILKIRKIGFWEYLVYTIGLSIAFLMFAGLAINWIFPLLHITGQPLSLIPLLISFHLVLSILGLIAYERNEDISLEIKFPKLDSLNKFFFILPIFLLVMSILAAINLNNGGSNILTMIVLGEITTYFFLIVLFRNKLNDSIYPLSIIITSLSMLLMFSLRSWYISGWDVSREAYVFGLTMGKQIWLINSYIDSYNSCLSISILPTIIKIMTSISPGMIFKVFIQIIFVFHSLTIFLIFRRYVKPVASFVAAFLYFGGVYYNSTFPTLIRQEVAFLSFGLMFLVLFNERISTKLKNILFIIFGFSTVVSHYSTSYIALVILIFIYIFNFIYKLYENRRIKRGELEPEKRERFYLKGWVILILLVFQIVWVAQFSTVSNDITGTAENTYKNIGRIFSESLNDSTIKNALLRKVGSEKYTDHELIEYIDENKKLFIPSDAYPIQQTQNFSPKITSSENVQYEDKNVASILFYLYQFIKYSIMFSIVFGTLFIFINKTEFIHKEFAFAIIISILLMFLIIVLPFIYKVYNFERLFQQSLMFFSLSSVIFFQIIMKRFRSFFLFFAILLYAGYSLFTMGFLLPLSGGNPTMNLYNKGFFYDTFYTHKEEVSSINWLSVNYQSEDVYMDPHSQLKFYAFGDPTMNIKARVIPIFMSKSAYVYSSYSNTTKGLNYLDAREKFDKGVISFNFPNQFLDENKNKIYNNGSSEIFK